MDATEMVLEEAEVKRVIAEGAEEVVLAIDSSKLDRRATVVCLDWTKIDVLVTDLDPADPRLAPNRDLVAIA